MLATLLLYILANHCILSSAAGSDISSLDTEISDLSSSSSSEDSDEPQQQESASFTSDRITSIPSGQLIIQIDENGDGLQFSVAKLSDTDITSYSLPKEYPIGTTLKIITSAELAKHLVLNDKNPQNHPAHQIPLRLSDDLLQIIPDDNSYQVQLEDAGDFCFIKLPTHSMDIPLNNNNYCFRVLSASSNILSNAERIIFIQHGATLDLSEIKRMIRKKLHINSSEIDINSNLDNDSVIPDVDSNSRESLDSKDFDELSHPINQQQVMMDNYHNEPIMDGLQQQQYQQMMDGNYYSQPMMNGLQQQQQQQMMQQQATRMGGMQQQQQPQPQQQQQQPPDTQMPDTPISYGGSSDFVSNYDGMRRRRIMGDADKAEHGAAMIGINMLYETRGILISEIESEKLLFLVQHIVDKLIPFLSSNDVLITLPVSKKLKDYDRATVSERVALIVNNARKKKKELKNCYELQYSINEESTFGGRIILGVDDNDNSLDVPMLKLKFVDIMISIGTSKTNNNIIGISVLRTRNEKHICYQQIVQIKNTGYDNLNDIADKISKCILHNIGIKNVNNLNIYITNNGNTINLNGDEAEGKEGNIAIEFELQLHGDECCLIDISSKSMHHKIYKDDDIGNKENRQIILLRANRITVVPSKSLLSSKTHHIDNIIFYVDIIDDFDKYEYEMDLLSHSKIKSLHYLFYSSNEYVSIPSGLWYLCASWRETLYRKNIKKDEILKQIETSKCSDDLYFNANFLINHPSEFEILNEINQQNQDEINKLDTSGFLQLQLIHLQQLLQQINNLRNELNQQKQNEINIYHNLIFHRLSSKSYLNHLKQIEKMYQNQLNKNGENKIERDDLKNQLKIIQQRLKNDENFEKLYHETLIKFKENEIINSTKKRKKLQNQIENSYQQIIRLQLSMNQQHQMLKALKKQIDAIQIHATN